MPVRAGDSRMVSSTGLIGLGVLCGNFLVVSLIWSAGAQHIEASLALVLCFVLFSVQYSWLLMSPAFMPVSFSTLVFWGYGFLMPGLYQVRTGDFFWASRAITPEIIADAALVVLMGSVAFFAAFVMTRPATFRQQTTLSTRLPGAALPVIIAFLYVGMVLATSGPVVFFAPRGAVIALAKAGGDSSALHGLTLTLSRGLALASLAIAGSVHLQRRTRGSLGLLVIALITNGVANFPFSVPRFYLVALFFVLGLTVFRKMFIRYARLAYVAAPIMLFLVFPTLGRFSRRKEFEFEFADVSFTEYLAHGDLDGFESVMNVVLLVQDWGFTFGQRIASAFLFFVPRSIWSGKAGATGQDAAENANYFFTNISMPAPGEFYADFGLIGVVIGMAAIGYLIRYLDNLQSGDGFAMVLGILLAAFAPILLRGSLLSTNQGFAASAFLVAVWYGIGRMRRRTRW